MAPFATQEWIDEISRAAASVAVDPDLDLVVDYRLDDDPTAWHVTLTGGAVRIAAGRAGESTISLTSSRAVAEDIHAGRLSAQRAFLDGALRIGGDVNALISHRDALGVVATVLAAAT